MTADAALPAGLEAVVIGTSAGGVQALSVLLPALPKGATVAILVVVHLPRDRPSLLVDVFARKCALLVCEAQDKEPVLPGTVYFAPTNYHLLVDAGPCLALSADDPVHHSRPSIDVLFESAAEIYKERLLGIILSGANEDGARGLAAVHDAGGVTVVQRPDTAQAPQMIESALRLTPSSRALTLPEMAALLGSLHTRTATAARAE